MACWFFFFFFLFKTRKMTCWNFNLIRSVPENSEWNIIPLEVNVKVPTDFSKVMINPYGKWHIVLKFSQFPPPPPPPTPLFFKQCVSWAHISSPCASSLLKKIQLSVRKPDLAILYALHSCKFLRYCVESNRPIRILWMKYMLNFWGDWDHISSFMNPLSCKYFYHF